MGAVIGAIFVILIGGALYFLPTIVAWQRDHNLGGVFIVNLLLGWTFIGWVIALVMACGSRPAPVTVIQQQGNMGAARFDPQTGEPLSGLPPAPAEPSA